MVEQLTLAVFDTIAVEPTRDVLLGGADSISGGVFLFAHHHVAMRPATVTSDRVWMTGDLPSSTAALFMRSKQLHDMNPAPRDWGCLRREGFSRRFR